MRNTQWLILLLLLSIGVSCQKNREQKQFEEAVKTEKSFSQSEMVNAIKSRLDTLQDYRLCHDKFAHRSLLIKRYQENDYSPLWIGYFKANDPKAFFNLLDSAKHYGLWVEAYHPGYIKWGLSQLDSLIHHFNYRELAHMDVWISEVLLQIHRDHKKGRLQPHMVLDGFYHWPKDTVPLEKPEYLLKEKNWSSYFLDNPIKHRHFKVLQQTLDSVYTIAGNINFPHWPDTLVIRPGEYSTLVPWVRKQMIHMGFADSNTFSDLNSNVLNDETTFMIKMFQDSIGLYPDGVLGANTIQNLFKTKHDFIDEVRINMEHIRWYPNMPSPPYVYVNLPHFTLRMFYDEDSVKQMRVCIGKARSNDYDQKYAEYLKTKKWWKRPLDPETPQIYSKVEYFVMNPYWTVPRSIISREMWGKMIRNPNYLTESGYEVLYKGERLNADTIPWKNFSAIKQPFVIRQLPGEANALGRVKFMFRNPFSIYMHDTNLKSKFNQSARAVSHGCVRLQQPIEMMHFVGRFSPKHEVDDYRIMMGYPPLDSVRLEEYDPLDSLAEIQPIDTMRLFFTHKPIPLYFDYRTLDIDTAGKVRVKHDVYRKNRKVLNAIRRSY